MVFLFLSLYFIGFCFSLIIGCEFNLYLSKKNYLPDDINVIIAFCAILLSWVSILIFGIYRGLRLIDRTYRAYKLDKEASKILYMCNKCGGINNGKKWNEETREKHLNITSIHKESNPHVSFVCPNCESDVFLEYIKKIKRNSIEKIGG